MTIDDDLAKALPPLGRALRRGALALVLARSVCLASAADRVSCPRLIVTAEGAAHSLSTAHVFQGSVSKDTELKSVHGVTDLPGGESFTLECLYNGTSDTQTLAIPRTATSCTVADAGAGTVAGCR